ncbi:MULTISPECIES: efflux RND transporter periplasmic adaptor subunit [unclassified Beijerinckia]|uniref:efflux RND transporter periplasmic adaptor subunit n=1 Tax=unclassified Beijerinckia TaxID=2638183 RepID=UPI0008958DF6|nr:MULTISPECIES: efflux RND transporter periplasmic adaptor subunit [unclassified Beijerinckia]MDH7796695.1 membrane fusion protein (multidrug efflux system) [Beijerinckia sp. GAS462]SEC56056.1 membrane fusion protein, multidrug efflux system [Beijerinckia sp. 28-YEA-48]
MRSQRFVRNAGVGLILTAATALAGCNDKNAAGTGPQGAAPQVGVVTIKRERIAVSNELPGRTTAFLIAEVRPQVGGLIQSRVFKEGSEVKAGDLLYQIDPASYQASYDSAKAALEKAEANVVSSQLKAKRYGDLAKQKAVSQQDADDAAATLKQNVADVASAKAALDSAQINLTYTKLTSPISGRVGKSSVTAGALVTASQSTSLAIVQQLDPIYVDVTQSSTQLLRLKRQFADGTLKNSGAAGSKVKLLLPDGSVYPLEGHLEFSDVTVSTTTGAVTLRAVFPNPNEQLLPGMYVRAVVEEGIDEQGILVPQQGVTRDQQGNATALIVNSDNKVEARAVGIHRAIGNNWWISKGLEAGDRLILDGIQRIRPGATVQTVALEGAGKQAATSSDPAVVAR